jgi:cytochrome c oxidase subunit 2
MPESYEELFEKVAERHERVWIFISIVLMALLFVGTVLYVAFDFGVVTKTAGSILEPASAAAHGPFAHPGVYQKGPLDYVVYERGQMWSWTPDQMHFPVGAHVTFYVTSIDVLHGFEVIGTDVNVETIPGEIAKVSTTFPHPGVYPIVCNEYCGLGHQGMYGQIIVGGH